MIEYLNDKKRPAQNREIKTTIYHILRNTEAIGNKNMPYDLLIRRTTEHLEEIRLTHTTEQVENALNEMLHDDMIYHVDGFVGLII